MPKNGWDKNSWVGLVPNGLNQVKPNHYFEIARTAWKNRRELPFAWRILTQGVCDGCALGTSGIRDFTMDGVHLCLVRLELLHLNTMSQIDESHLSDAENLASMNAAQLRELGRLPFPMIRRKGERSFSRISWSDAARESAEHIKKADPRRIAFYLTSRGLTNETYYVAQKVARFLGTNNVDNSSRICHAPSTVALKKSLGVAASTCSYSDWIGTDLLILFGSNTPNNQPVTTKYIYHAKKEGTKVIVINPYREPGLERYWVPSVTESALFGTKIADHFFTVKTGGDRAFIAGTIKHIIEQGWQDQTFVERYTQGLTELKRSLDRNNWEILENQSGATRQEMFAFARLLSHSKSAVMVWSMGITQHQHAVANVRAIADLALIRGFIGRPKCGLMAIRGHSGVQGGAEVGAVPNQFPGGLAIDESTASKMSSLWGFEVPSKAGLNAVAMIDAAHRREIDVFYQIGGNFLETMPEPDYVREAVERIPLRIHQDIVLSPQMMVEPDETVIVLPAQTRYEQAGGGTETTTERRIIFSPEIEGRRIGETLPEWEIPMRIAEAVHPERADKIHFADAQSIRDEIALAVPAYDGIQHLRKAGDQVQWGGTRLCEEVSDSGENIPAFPTSDGRARFSALELSEVETNGGLMLSTRRGKQFNSMVQKRYDPLTGAWREDVLISSADASQRGLKDGDSIIVRSAAGEMKGRCRIAPIAKGSVQAHWPEANVLIKRGVTDPECGIPDFNTVVEITRAAS